MMGYGIIHFHTDLSQFLTRKSYQDPIQRTREDLAGVGSWTGSTPGPGEWHNDRQGQTSGMIDCVLNFNGTM